MNPILLTEHYTYKRLILLGFLFLGGLLLINEFATRFHIYFVYKWFDTPMHFLGGFGVGIVAIALLRSWFTREVYDSKPQMLYTLIIVLGVGVVWEIIETFYKVSVIYGGHFWIDTSKDLLIDTFGGILSYICFHQHLKE